MTVIVLTISALTLAVPVTTEEAICRRNQGLLF
jgi:hypothetical protein